MRQQARGGKKREVRAVREVRAARLEAAFDLASGSYASERRASTAPTVATTAVTSVTPAGRLLASSPGGDRRRMIPRSAPAVVAVRVSRARLAIVSRDRR